MKDLLEKKSVKFGLFCLILFFLDLINNTVSDYFVMKNPNAYLNCGVRKYEYFDSYETRSNNLSIGSYSISQCRGGKLAQKNYLVLTDYDSGYIYRALPLNLSEDEMHFRHEWEDSITITIQFVSDPDGKEVFFCFYKPIPDIYHENDRETKEEFIEKYNKKLEKLDKRECF
ncbi:hypothetical protein [Avibacterium paragallinarum]|uniref:hypothetical protein n=1 Tax=Avibacterium paragallinarum TaxID=728 RepID=UPI002ED8BA6B